MEDDSEVVESLAGWLATHVPGYHGQARLKKFGFGQSNPTYHIQAESGDYVLRRKPFGVLLPKAHMIEREYHMLHALGRSDVPAPRVLAYCDDLSVLGVPFYVMQFVPGRIFYDQRLPGMDASERAAIFDAVLGAVVRLHKVDPGAIGLEGFGRGERFMARQVELWTRQYRASEGEPIPAMERLIEWLPRHLPVEQPAQIFHGDLRLDNMVFHPTEPRVIALLDWELSTLGDPIADFAYHSVVWRIPHDLFRGFGGLDLPTLGIPQEDTYVASYREQTGLDLAQAWNFYLAFSIFRLASILQGVWRRAIDGQASNKDAVETGAKAAPLASIGWDIACRV